MEQLQKDKEARVEAEEKQAAEGGEEQVVSVEEKQVIEGGEEVAEGGEEQVVDTEAKQVVDIVVVRLWLLFHLIGCFWLIVI